MRRKKCKHPSYAMVLTRDSLGRESGILYCYECEKNLPFFFYQRTEWEEILRKREEAENG